MERTYINAVTPGSQVKIQGFVENLSDLIAGHVAVIEKAEYPVF